MPQHVAASVNDAMVVRTDVGKTSPRRGVPAGTDGIACGRFGGTRREWVAVAVQDRDQGRSPLDLTVAEPPMRLATRAPAFRTSAAGGQSWIFVQ